MSTFDLDHWLPEPAVRTHHRRLTTVSPTDVWAAAKTVRLADCRLLGRLVAVRLPGVGRTVTFDALFRESPFTLLEEGSTHALSGLCGRIWTVRRDYGTLAEPEAFRSWDTPGTVRVLFAHWATEADGGAALCSEVRVVPIDRRAAAYLRALEPFIAAFQSLVGRESLALAVARAER